MSIRLRKGFSSAEIVVTLALFGLISSLLLNTLAINQKVFRSIQSRILVSEQLRDGEQALMADIRGTAILADTLRLMSDSAIEMFSLIGSAVVCTSLSSQVVTLVPEGLSSGLMLSSLPVLPDTGDMLAVYPAPDSISGARHWSRMRILSVSSASAATNCPLGAGFTTSADAGRSALRITVAAAPVGGLTPGAPVRVLRRGRYSLYKSSDNEWYLGYKRCNAVATGCSTIQPVSGPYLAFAVGTGGGLRFRYLDSLGSTVPATRPLDVAAVEITLRAEADSSGRTSGRKTDSVLVTLSPRNLR